MRHLVFICELESRTWVLRLCRSPVSIHPGSSVLCFSLGSSHRAALVYQLPYPLEIIIFELSDLDLLDEEDLHLHPLLLVQLLQVLLQAHKDCLQRCFHCLCNEEHSQCTVPQLRMERGVNTSPWKQLSILTLGNVCQDCPMEEASRCSRDPPPS